MKLNKYIAKDQIFLNFTAPNKDEVLVQLVKKSIALGLVPGEMEEEVLAALKEREKLTSTGLGYGCAVPHIKTAAVNRINILYAHCPQGIDFEALDGNPVNFIFMMLAPEKVTADYLKILSAISALAKDPKARRRLAEAKTVEDVLAILG